METAALPDYRSTEGNLAAICLRSDRGMLVTVTMMSVWTSIEAITAFAGKDVDRARYYPFDDAFLLWKEPRVAHFELAGCSLAPGIVQHFPGCLQNAPVLHRSPPGKI